MRIQVAIAFDADVPADLRQRLEEFLRGAIEKAMQTHSGEIFYGGFTATPGTPPADITWNAQDSYFGPKRMRES